MQVFELKNTVETSLLLVVIILLSMWNVSSSS